MNIQMGSLVIVIIALCQALKYAGLSTRYIPLMAIVLGVVGSLYLGGVTWLTVLSGLIAAFTSSGMFSGFKTTFINR